MKNKIRKNPENTSYDDLFDLWIEKGLIEKRERGYHFRTDFFTH